VAERVLVNASDIGSDLGVGLLGKEKSGHAERVLVGVEQSLLFLAVGGIHAAQRDDLAHGLDVVSDALGLAVDVADVAAADAGAWTGRTIVSSASRTEPWNA
jgi:hypothetical protein